jgi:hypothetical protein
MIETKLVAGAILVMFGINLLGLIRSIIGNEDEDGGKDLFMFYGGGLITCFLIALCLVIKTVFLS